MFSVTSVAIPYPEFSNPSNQILTSVLCLKSCVLCLESGGLVATKNQSNARGGAKKFEYFQLFPIVSHYFSNIFKRFRTFSNVFKRFVFKLARLVRKSALLIEIRTHLRINLRI